MVYHQLGGRRDFANAADLSAALDDAAKAIASVATVHVAEPGASSPRALSSYELLKGRFTRGATAFIDAAGLERRGLTIRRADMRAALAILRAARVGFGRR